MTDLMWVSTAVKRREELGATPVLDTVTLDRESRFRRRIRLTADSGRPFMLDLAEATYLADGDALEVAGGVILVRAAAEPLMEVHAANGPALARIAWHIGNRHTPAEIAANAIYLQRDHVLQQMIEGLGGHVHLVMRAFEPEGGAYGGHGSLARPHSHGHGSHDHHHSHADAVTLYKKSAS